MRRDRVALGVAGGLLIGFGAFRLVTNLEVGDLLTLLLWLAVAVILHDALVAPLTVGAGVLLTRVPPRARRFVQGALVAGALITAVAIPLIGRRGSQPEAKAMLLRDYPANLAILLGLTAAVALMLYATRIVRDQRPPRD